MLDTPQHIAIIMDGNGRWAQKRLLPRQVGHVKGAGAVRQVVQACANRGIEYVTLFAFSTENWRRPPEEVSALMELFMLYLQKELRDMNSLGVRLRVIGDRKPFDARLNALIAQAETSTIRNTRLNLTVAANYGGQWDILQAMQAWQKAHPTQSLEALNASTLAEYLSMAGLPDPDLLVRTGGESRISNFLLWQLAYSELYFTPILWPDFDDRALDDAIQWYCARVRRFGRTDEQVKGSASP